MYILFYLSSVFLEYIDLSFRADDRGSEHSQPGTVSVLNLAKFSASFILFFFVMGMRLLSLRSFAYVLLGWSAGVNKGFE